MSSTVRLARPPSRSTTTTFAPAFASRIAEARPLPIPSPTAPPPVTMPTLPARPQSSGNGTLLLFARDHPEGRAARGHALDVVEPVPEARDVVLPRRARAVRREDHVRER